MRQRPDLNLSAAWWRRPVGQGRTMRVTGTSVELRKTGIPSFDLSDPYYLAVTMSWPLFQVIAMSCLVIINVVFGSLYAALPGAIQGVRPGDLLGAFFFSLETMSTVGYGEMAPASAAGHAIAGVEIVVGMTFTAIVTGLLFVRFSRPTPGILFPDVAVICRSGADKTLQVRVANGRYTMLSHAKASIGLILEDEDGGAVAITELELVKEELLIFPLTWTIEHTIRKDGPLFDLSEGRSARIRIFVAIEAHDVATGTDVHAMRDYCEDRLVLDGRYAAMARGQGARRVTDMAKLSELVT